MTYSNQVSLFSVFYSVQCCIDKHSGEVWEMHFTFGFPVLDRWLKMSDSFTREGFMMPDFTMEASAGIVGRAEWRIGDRRCPLNYLNNVRALNLPSFLRLSVQASLLIESAM